MAKNGIHGEHPGTGQSVGAGEDRDPQGSREPTAPGVLYERVQGFEGPVVSL